PVNNAPQGADKTVTTLEDTAYAFAAADFGFSDPDDTPPDSLLAVKITTLPSNGTLSLAAGSSAAGPVAAGQFISAADLAFLRFMPAANAQGAAYANFTFQVED